MAHAKPFHVGDIAVYRLHKHSKRPGPRAKGVRPAEHGDEYSYDVDKYWLVAAVEADGQLILQTRRGKQHRVRPDDPQLRRPNMWERFRHRRRFPQPLPPGVEADRSALG